MTQPHRSALPEVRRQRTAEYARTETAHDVQKLLQRHEIEDAEAPGREQLLAARIEQLERDLCALQAKVAAMPAAVGRSLGRLGAELRVRIDAIAERSAGLHYCGRWDQDQAYSCDDLVSHAGGAWIALNGMGAGVRPGTPDSSWKLIVKSDTAELARLVRTEVQKKLGGKPDKEKG